MITIQHLTSSEIDEYTRILEAQGIVAVGGIYEALANKGYGYAGWAYGVSTGDSITGNGVLLIMI